MEPTEQILKQDAAGRVWTPPARREAVLDEFERSGLPGTKFAAHVGIKYATLASWVQKRRRQREGAGSVTVPGPALKGVAGWVEATVERRMRDGSGALVVHLPGGAYLEVQDVMQAGLAAQLLRALGSGGVGC